MRRRSEITPPIGPPDQALPVLPSGIVPILHASQSHPCGPDVQEVTDRDGDRYITPAIMRAGWHQRGQIRREYSYTAGQMLVRGKVAVHGKQKCADY